MKFKPPPISPSDITNEALFLNRRQLIQTAAACTLPSYSYSEALKSCKDHIALKPVNDVTQEKFVRSYNNYYEFSTDKKAVSHLAKALTLDPWSIQISGLVAEEFTLQMEDIIKLCHVERTYRFRCVEGWSMVVPWSGIPLIDLVKLAKPLASAKYLKFTSLFRPKEMIGQRAPTLSWPYVEALRMDEATHPLTLLATGFYGKDLSAQNGAPLRLIVPWKYGYKSAKAITQIEFTEAQPKTTWMLAAPKEYDFYANVDPNIAHPRWSQRRETLLGQTHKIATQLYNGYAEYVAQLYPHT